MNSLSDVALLAVIVCYSAMAFSLFQKKRRTSVVLWWPLVMYIPGALAAYFLFQDHSVFANYFSEDSIAIVTLQFCLGFAVVFLTQRQLSNQINQDLRHTASRIKGRDENKILAALGASCIAVQIALIIATGASIFSGSYVLADGNFAENSALFTLSAGLYEIFAAIWALDLISRRTTEKSQRYYDAFFLLVLAARMLGGTRLIILKFAIFVLLVRLIQGKIKLTSFLAVGGLFLGLITLVGSLRGSESADDNNLIFLLLAEPALGNLSATFTIDFYLDKSTQINWNAPVESAYYLLFIAIHLLPNFVYQLAGGEITLLGDWGYYRTLAAPFYPFREILNSTGMETISPVGGQSIIALGSAIFGPYLAFLIIPGILHAFRAIGRLTSKAVPVMLIFAFEAPSLYRDSTEIFVKQIFIIALGYFAIKKTSQWLSKQSKRNV